jgi:hypothetical protein
MEPSMRVAADERQGDQHHETSGEEWPHGAGRQPLITCAPPSLATTSLRVEEGHGRSPIAGPLARGNTSGHPTGVQRPAEW